MLETTELRWVCSGTLPEVTQHWFQYDCPSECLPPEEREDLYLSTAGCEHLGIKLRQEQLEIKWREAELGVLRCWDLDGKAEQWIKSICADSEVECIIPKVTVKGLWIRVRKVRSQRKYQVLPNQSLIAVPVSQPSDPGCAVELTTLRIKGNSWWSQGFEAGKGDPLRDIQVVASEVLKTYRGPKLGFQDSYAYPKWLSIAL